MTNGLINYFRKCQLPTFVWNVRPTFLSFFFVNNLEVDKPSYKIMNQFKADAMFKENFKGTKSTTNKFLLIGATIKPLINS